MQLFRRILLQVFGYSFMSLGIAMIIHSKQGSFPYDAISFYLAEIIPFDFMTIGIASMAFGFLWMILNFILVRKLRVFSAVIIILTIGSLIDFFYYTVFGSYVSNNIWMNLMMAIVGLIIVCFAVGIVILNPRLPVAPSETLLVHLQSKMSISWLPKILIEGSLALIAFILGLIVGDFSQLGWFTLLCIFGCGPMITFFNNIFRKFISVY